jgi:uncharacterized protein (UPF0264 family)
MDSPGESRKKCPVRLLVSVRDLREAEIAVAAQVDWLDVKDPNQGPLGRPRFETASAIAQLAARLSPGLRVSVALGESREASMLELLDYVQHFDEATSFKLAFSNRNHGSTSEIPVDDDRRNWSLLFRELAGRLSRGRLIPVFYADREFARGPAWEAVVELASEVGGNRILIDTFNKDGRSLINHLNHDVLAEMIHFAAEQCISVAVAGSLRKSEIPTLMKVGADVIGVRGAACKATNRVDSIDPASLQELTAIFKSQLGGAMDPQIHIRKP